MSCFRECHVDGHDSRQAIHKLWGLKNLWALKLGVRGYLEQFFPDNNKPLV
jgi:hypothetical protein